MAHHRSGSELHSQEAQSQGQARGLSKLPAFWKPVVSVIITGIVIDKCDNNPVFYFAWDGAGAK